MSLNYSASTSSIGTNNVFHDRGTLHVTKDDYKADFKYPFYLYYINILVNVLLIIFFLNLCMYASRASEYAQASSSSSSSLFPDGNREKRDLNKVIEQDLTTQVMDSMDMMFGVLSNGKEDVDRVKITLSKKVLNIFIYIVFPLSYLTLFQANNQLDMKVKTSQGEPPISMAILYN